jgi:hypothetical protein
MGHLRLKLLNKISEATCGSETRGTESQKKEKNLRT